MRSTWGLSHSVFPRAMVPQGCLADPEGFLGVGERLDREVEHFAGDGQRFLDVGVFREDGAADAGGWVLEQFDGEFVLVR